MKLDNIKVAIFDFDETLAIHKDKDFVEHRNESEEKLLNYYLNAYLNPDLVQSKKTYIILFKI